MKKPGLLDERPLTSAIISGVDTRLGLRMIGHLMVNGWRLRSEYGSPLGDKAISYDYYLLVKGKRMLFFEWSCELQWRISGWKSAIYYLSKRYSLKRRA
ncbi:hypothetical protein KUV89_03170 [Marinobacter hydrocarbonoclasticus]|nr:hypothetical protein [Marinobacter nauticus]